MDAAFIISYFTSLICEEKDMKVEDGLWGKRKAYAGKGGKEIDEVDLHKVLCVHVWMSHWSLFFLINVC